MQNLNADTVSGPFSRREFVSGDLKIFAFFSVPALKLVAVQYVLPHMWTKPQKDGALDANGTEWRPDYRSMGVYTWQLPDGTKAVSILNQMHFLTPSTVAATKAAAAAAEAKRKAVPKF